jgi:hypothetical protein
VRCEFFKEKENDYDQRNSPWDKQNESLYR